MKIYDENQFTKSKLDERGNSLGLEDSDNNISLSKSCLYIKKFLLQCIKYCEKKEVSDCDLSGVTINGIKIKFGHIYIDDKPDKKLTDIYLEIRNMECNKEIVLKYLDPFDQNSYAHIENQEHYKMFKKRMESFFKIDKTKGEKFEHKYGYKIITNTGDYSDTVYDDYKLYKMTLNLVKHYK